MILVRVLDVTGVLNPSCYIVVDNIVTYIVDYFIDPRVPRPNMWLEVYCHIEAPGTVGGSFFLCEDGTQLLLEDGSSIPLEHQ